MTLLPKSLLTPIVITGVLAASLTAPKLRAEDFTPPLAWTGVQAGSAEGNPGPAGAPVWRLDQTINGDPTDLSAYRPMKWNGKKWLGELEFGGQPSISIKDFGPELAIRGKWQGDAAAKTNKVPILTFIAPKAGEFTVKASMEPSFWAKSATIQVLVIKGSEGVSEVVTAVEVPKDGGPVALEASAQLKAGDTLSVAGIIDRYHTAGNLALKGFVISSK